MDDILEELLGENWVDILIDSREPHDIRPEWDTEEAEVEFELNVLGIKEATV